MEKATLTLVKKTERTSARTGKPFTSLSIKSEERGDVYLSGFANKDNANWKEGDVVEIEVKEVEKEGKTYLNFETPKKDDLVMIELGKIRFSVGALRNDILDIKEHLKLKAKDLPYPTREEEGMSEDSPF